MNQKAGNLPFFIILISLLSIIPLRSLRFEFNIGNLLPSRDSDLEFYKEFQYQFQSQVDEEEIIFIGLQNHAGIFHQEFLKKTDALTQYLSSQPQIAKVYSVTNSNIIFFVDSQIQARPLIHITQPELYQHDSVYLFLSKEYRDHLVSTDGKTIAVAAFSKQHLTRAQKNKLLSDVEQKLNNSGFDKTHLISKIRGEKILAADMVRDGTKMIIIFVLLLVALLFFIFRSLILMIFPLVVIIISNLWTFALVSLAGISLDYLTSYLPILITAVSIFVSIPIVTNYKEALKNESSKLQAAEISIKHVRTA
ncbi:MAG: MMPL family transporter, partial [Flavisolibacter sp.]